jgi:F-type H+-transporting ATPase subunit delta
MTNSTGISTIADRYAEAMLQIADENQTLDYVKNDIPLVANTIKENSDLKVFLEHPVIPLKDKKEVIEKIFDGKINPSVITLVKLLIDRNRMFIYDAIVDSFKTLFNKKFNILTAKITTAINIDDGIKENIRLKLSEILSKQVEVELKVSPDILGGVIIQVEDNIIDGSVYGRLERIKQQLI